MHRYPGTESQGIPCLAHTWLGMNGWCGNSWELFLPCASLHQQPSQHHSGHHHHPLHPTATKARAERNYGGQEMFLFWDLTSPSPPGEGGRKVRGYEGHSSDLPGAFPSVLLPPTPSWVLPPESVRLPYSHQIAVAVLMSWSCPYSKLILGWDLPQTGPCLPSKPAPWPQQSLLVGSNSSAPQASLMQLFQS